MGSYADAFRIHDGNLRLRRDFIGLTPADVAVLRRLKGWGASVAETIAREFYDVQVGFAPTRKFFDAFAAAKGMPIDALRRHLEGAQAGYFRQIFEEAAGEGTFGEVTSAVSEMPSATQSNAAQAEELSATAGSLSQRAGELQDLTRAFALG